MNQPPDPRRAELLELLTLADEQSWNYDDTIDRILAYLRSPASPPEPPASPPPAPVTPEWAVRQDGRFRSLAQRIYAHLWGGKGLKLSVQDKSDLVEAITLARHAPAAAPDERVERLEQALKDAYRENQNMHCSTTISPKIGWDALERQTAILKAALAESRKV